MHLLPSENFYYKNDEMYCEEIPIKKLAGEFGTPLFVYSKNFFVKRFKEFEKAFAEIDHTIFFASKANFNLNVMKIFYDLGSGIDVNSAGELYRALKIGADPKRIILTGVGKTKEEIKLGIENEVLLIKAESEGEIHLINKIAGEMGKVAPVAIRVNPNVDAKTHPYISTGLSENKFGVNSEEALDLFLRASKLPNIKLTGIDMHIGSQISQVLPYVEAVQKMADLFFALKSKEIELQHFDIGGGMGVIYKDEKLFDPKELADVLIPIFKNLNCKIMFEPGRYLTANGGILLAEVLYTKKNKNKNFIVVDAAMTELLRPSLYGAFHNIQPVKLNNSDEINADIVGPVCETGDFLGKERTIQNVEPGDYLAAMTTGAYGMAMSSNYNGRRRPPEIIVDSGKYFVARGRETYEHLIFDEDIVESLHK